MPLSKLYTRSVMQDCERELINGETQLAKLVLSALVLQVEQQDGTVPT